LLPAPRPPPKSKAAILADQVETMLVTAAQDRSRLQADLVLKQEALEKEVRTLNELADTAMDQQNQELLAEVDRLEAALEVAHDEIADQKKAYERAAQAVTDQIKLFHSDNSRKDTKISKLQDRVAGLLETVKSLEAELLVRNTDVARTVESLQKAEEEVTLWEDRFTKVDMKYAEKQIEDQKRWEAKMQHDWEVWREKLHEEEARRQADRERADQAEEDARQAEKDMLEMDEEMSMVKRRLAECLQELHDARAAEDELEPELEELETELQLKNELVSQLEKERDALAARVQHLEESHEAVIKEKDGQYEAKDRQMMRLANELAEAEAAVEEWKKVVSDNEAKVQKALDNEAAMQKKVAQAEQQVVESEAELETGIREMERKATELIAQREQLESDKQKIRKVLEMSMELELQKEQMARQLAESHARVEKIQAEYAQKAEDNDQKVILAEAKAARSEASLRTALAEVTMLTRISSGGDISFAMEKAMTAKNREISQLRRQVTETEARLEASHDRLEGLQEELNAMNLKFSNNFNAGTSEVSVVRETPEDDRQSSLSPRGETESPEKLLARADAVAAQGDHAKAARLYNQAYDADSQRIFSLLLKTGPTPRSFTIDSSIKLEACLGRAAMARHLPEVPLKEAHEDLELALKLAPKTTKNAKAMGRVFKVRADLHLYRHQPPEYNAALADYDLAISKGWRDDAELWNNRSEALRGLQRFEQALQGFKYAQSLGYTRAGTNYAQTLHLVAAEYKNKY